MQSVLGGFVLQGYSLQRHRLRPSRVTCPSLPSVNSDLHFIFENVKP